MIMTVYLMEIFFWLAFFLLDWWLLNLSPCPTVGNTFYITNEHIHYHLLIDIYY